MVCVEANLDAAEQHVYDISGHFTKAFIKIGVVEDYTCDGLGW